MCLYCSCLVEILCCSVAVHLGAYSYVPVLCVSDQQSRTSSTCTEGIPKGLGVPNKNTSILSLFNVADEEEEQQMRGSRKSAAGGDGAKKNVQKEEKQQELVEEQQVG